MTTQLRKLCLPSVQRFSANPQTFSHFTDRIFEGKGSIILTAKGGALEEMKSDGIAVEPMDIVAYGPEGAQCVDRYCFVLTPTKLMS
ncbi:MAG: hypothetical protein ABJ327_24310 [Litoreibacter sp.]